MSDEIKYKNNPLNGVSLKTLVTELVAHYGFDILFAYLNINCFKTNPNIDSSVKFLKKTEWAREKVEVFYMYQFKSYPRASSTQFQFPPRDRVVPDDQVAGEPAVLSLEDADRLKEKRVIKAAEYNKSQRGGKSYPQRKTSGFKQKRDDNYSTDDNSSSSKSTYSPDEDPWANWRK
jgi:uncharacterized protein (DUF2132 family)